MGWRLADTVGQLIDKLSICNNKLWHVQEQAFRFQKMSSVEYEAIPAQETKTAFERLASLNLERNALVREIDEALAAGNFKVAHNIKVEG